MLVVIGAAAARPLPVLLLATAGAVVTWRTEGSIAAPDWLPLAVLAALVLTTVVAAGAAAIPPPAVLVGAGAIVLLAAWTAASTTWSASPAGARDEALLTALYAVALVVAALVVPGRPQQERAVAALVGVLAVVAALAALDLAVTADPARLLFGGRLDFPISYVNADAALFMLGFWPAVATAARRAAPPALRAAGLAAATLFLSVGVAAQSKGAVVGLAVSALLVFALAPVRLRLLAPSLLAAVPAAVGARALTEPYRSAAASAAHRAGFAALVACAVGAGLGVVYAYADRRLELSDRRRQTIARAVAGIVVAAAAAGLAAFLVTVPSPGGWAAQKWHAFKHPPAGQTGSTHLSSLGSNRYDFWRVALDETRAHPLRGIGGRSFYSAYLQHGRSAETPLRAHSLYLDVAAEEGVPGLLLLLVGLGAPLVLLARRLRTPAGVAAFGAGTYFCAHAAVDWIWTVPAVGLPAFLLIGAGCAADRTRPLPRAGAVSLAAAGALAALLGFAPPWLASRFVSAAYHSKEPSHELARARFFDPLSLDPYWAEWRLAATPAAQVRALVRARRLEPRSVAVLYHLGLAYRRERHTAQAVVTLQRAAQLDPRDRIVLDALRAARR